MPDHGPSFGLPSSLHYAGPGLRFLRRFWPFGPWDTILPAERLGDGFGHLAKFRRQIEWCRPLCRKKTTIDERKD